MLKQSPYWIDSNVEQSKKKLQEINLTPEIKGHVEHEKHPKSWFYTNIEKIQDPETTFLWEDLIEAHGKQTSITKTHRSRLTRIYPNKDQKAKLNVWMNDARLLYNTAVAELNGTEEKSNKYTLRNDLVISKDTKQTDAKILQSMEQTPKDIRAKAVFEACAAHDLSIKKQTTLNPKYVEIEKQLKPRAAKKLTLEAKLKLETDLKFTHKYQAKKSKLQFRKRKDQYSHIFIPKTAVEVKDKIFRVYKSYKIGDIKAQRSLKITADFQIRVNHRLDIWHVITSEEITAKAPVKEAKTLVIDPGVRTFLTCLTSDGFIIEVGKNWSLDQKIKERILKLDRCSELLTPNGRMKSGVLREIRGRERFTLLKAKREVHLHRRKLTNMINDMHKKTAAMLLDSYDVIVLPKLTGKTLKKEGNPKLNRNFNLLAHGKFHDYITWKAQTLGKVVVEQDEAYTTQTCFECGVLNDIGSSKVYECQNCGQVIDRDIQSCFNILTRYMGSYSPPFA